MPTTTPSSPARIAILGFGYSGLAVAANLVRMASCPLTLYIIDANGDAKGVAYGTANTDHLLNVRAGNMSALADAPNHLVDWLKTADAAIAQQKLGLAAPYGTDDFIPRALYGAYLESIWRETQTLAAQKKLEIKLVPSDAVAVQASPYAVLTARGDAIAVDAVVLATGHEMKPLFANSRNPHIVQNPWAADAFAGAQHWAAPVCVIGSGLTAVDVLLSLRHAGYAGEVVLCSRHGWLPHTHVKPAQIFSFSADEIAAHKTLRALLQLVQQSIATQGDWRVVLDALRQHTQAIWLRLSLRDKQRFISRVLPFWNVHRHRMAPEIAARVEAEMATKTLHVQASKKLELRDENDGLNLAITTAQGVQQLKPSRIINGTGLELNVERSSNPLIRQLLAEGWIEAHATGLGIAADPAHRAWGVAHPELYVLGSLLTGQLLESTAVPELRVEAAAIAKQLLG